MRKRNKMRLILSILLSFWAISCTPSPPDVPVCENLPQRLISDPETDHLLLEASPTCEKRIAEVACGHCTYIISGKEIYIGERKPNLLNGKPWSQIKLESVYV